MSRLALVLGLLLGLVACSGPVDLKVVNGCDFDVHIRTFDGTMRGEGWVPDIVPVADFTVGARSSKKVRARRCS